MRVETKESLTAKVITAAIFRKSCLDKSDMIRLIEKELKKFKL